MKLYKVLIYFFLLHSIPVHAQNFDINLLKSINQNQSGFKDDYSSMIAKTASPATIIAPIGFLVAGWAKKDKKLMLDAAYFAGGYLLSASITHGAKRVIQRERPFNKYSFIIKRDAGGNYSFPSGHTSSAFFTATFFSIAYPKWYVIAPAYVWASSMGWARIYQGVHYPTDVLAGAIVGAGSAWATYKVQQWMNKKNTSTQSVATPAL